MKGKSMLQIILIVLVAIIAIILVIAATKPDNFRVSRSITIAASPDLIFPHVNNFYQWGNWSPWIKIDPNAVMTFEGPTEGVGAITRWSGNNQVGQGSMTITESRPSDYIGIKLDFLKPMKGTNTTEFTFKQEGSQTLVTWSMFGKNNFIAKIMNVFINCDKMIVDQYDKGLANLKSVVEAK